MLKLSAKSFTMKRLSKCSSMCDKLKFHLNHRSEVSFGKIELVFTRTGKADNVTRIASFNV